MDFILPLIAGGLLLLGTGLGLWITYNYRQDSKSKQDKIKTLNEEIDKVGKRNEELNKNIFEISKKSESITSNLQKITKDVKIVTDKTQALTNENLELSKLVRDLNTGGQGYIDLRNSIVSLYSEGVQANGFILDLHLDIYNNGDFAFDNIKIKGFQSTDYLNAEPIFLWTDLSSSGLNIHSRFSSTNNNIHMQGMKSFSSKAYLKELDYEAEVFKPGQSVLIGPIRFKENFEYYGVNLFVESRRQDWIILIRFQKPKDKSHPFVNQIYRILKVKGDGLKEVFQTKTHSFPKFENGKTKWFKEEMPEIWFSKK